MSSPSYSPKKETERKGTEEEDETELNQLFDAMGIERLKRCELAEPLKTVIADLWRTRRIGKNAVSRQTVKKALSCLSPELLEAIFDKFDRQAKKRQIAFPTDYIKALILNTPQDVALVRLAQQNSGAVSQDGLSFDINEFVRLSLEKLNGKNSVS